MQQLLNRIAWYGFWALLVYMPFHIFLAQSLSMATGGLEVWKVAKDVVLAALVLFTICLVWRQGKGTKLFWGMLSVAAVYAALHVAVWVAHSDIASRSAVLGMVYNLRLPGFLVLGYGVARLHPTKFTFSSVFKIVIGVSSIVSLLGVLQYFLPSDVLTHLGYGLERGTRPMFFIDDNPALPRIMSTLREPNALGAYLVLPAAALAVAWSAVRARKQRLGIAGLFVLHAAAIFLTHSRSAWLALPVAVALALWWANRQAAAVLFRRFWPVLAVGVVLLTVGVATQRNAHWFQQYVIHSDPTETVDDLDSNDYHWLLVKEGAQGALAQPMGHGPGTAGLASIQSPGATKLTENYYVQLAYEVGVLGLVLFVAASAWLYVRLWHRRDQYAAVLCAAFWAYVLTNMLLHSWANEAVAAQWWLLAGVAAALPLATTKQPQD